MSEYVNFSEIDEDDSRWSEDQIEASDFFHKLDWEGGIDGLMSYGGPDYFPAEVRELAVAYEQALNALDKAITQWGKDRGVVY